MKLEKIKKLHHYIIGSEKTIVLTGAGVSTESGIPDYRSPGKGLWKKMDKSVVDLSTFIKKPETYYLYAKELYPQRKQAKPNVAHYYISELEKKGMLSCVITQNVDGLHRLAGSKNVYELHGNIQEVVCLGCGKIEEMHKVMKRVDTGENPPMCKICGGILKPNAVFFGEALPLEAWNKSLEELKDTKLLVVIGTSLLVYPVNTFPAIAKENGSKLVIINSQKTPVDDIADLIINEKIGDVFEQLNKLW